MKWFRVLSVSRLATIGAGLRPAIPLSSAVALSRAGGSFAVTRSKLSAHASSAEAGTAQYTLYDIPVSNNGARVRMILYYKDVSSEEVRIESPEAIGGLRCPDFEAVNAQRKIPALVCRDEVLCVPESDTIARFLGGKYNDRPGTKGDFGPAPGSILAVKADRICRHHDIYLASIQGCLYKATPRDQGFAKCGTRGRALDEFVLQLDILETLIDNENPGPYLLGPEPTHADVAVFPTLVFAERMLPKFDKPFRLGPKLADWWKYMTSGADPVAAKVHKEILSGLDSWDARDRWGSVLGAGLRDDSPATIFDKILAGDIPAKVVYEDNYCLAFEDINPVAPVHILLIPKERSGLTQLQCASDDHIFLLGHLMSKVGHVARLAHLKSYRVVVNDGAEALQSVFHLHLHIIGGRELAWPPG